MLSIIASVLYYTGLVVFGIAMIVLIARVANKYDKAWEGHQEMVKDGVLIK